MAFWGAGASGGGIAMTEWNHPIWRRMYLFPFQSRHVNSFTKKSG